MKTVYRGIIIGTNDPKGIGRYLVHIPAIMSGADTESDGIWCDNGLNNIIRFKRQNTSEINSMGNYTPLKEGMGVDVEFSNGFHGKIVGVIDDSNIPSPDKSNRDGFHQLLSTIDNTYIYYDEQTKKFHILINNGETNLIFNKESFHLNVGHTIPNKVVGEKGVEEKTGTLIKIVDKGITMQQNETFFRMFEDEFELRTSKTSFIRLNKNVLEMYAPNIIINSDEKTHIHSDKDTILSSTNSIGFKTKDLKVNCDNSFTLKTLYTNIHSTNNFDINAKSSKFDVSGWHCTASTSLFSGSVTANGSMSSSSIYGLVGIFGSVSSPSPTMSVNPSAPSIASGIRTTVGNTAKVTVTIGTNGSPIPSTVEYGNSLSRKILSDSNMYYKDIEFISSSVIKIRKHDNLSNKNVISQSNELKQGKLW